MVEYICGKFTIQALQTAFFSKFSGPGCWRIYRTARPFHR